MPQESSSVTFKLLVFSLVISVLSISFAETRKLLAMLGGGSQDRITAYSTTLAYFTSDAVFRAAAFAGIFVAQGAYLAAWIGGWVAIDLAAGLYLSRWDGENAANLMGVKRLREELEAGHKELTDAERAAKTKAVANSGRGTDMGCDRAGRAKRKIPFKHANILCLCESDSRPHCVLRFFPFCLEYQYGDGVENRSCLCIQSPEFMCCVDDKRIMHPYGNAFFDCVADWRRFHVFLPIIWTIRAISLPIVLIFQVPQHRTHIAAAGLTLLTSFPLSSKTRDRLRVFTISTVVSAAMVAVATLTLVAKERTCRSVDDNNAAVDATKPSGSGDFEVGRANECSVPWFNLMLAAACAGGCKVASYIGSVHGMKEGEKGSTSAVGFSVFSLDSEGEALVGSWSASDWSVFLKDEKNAQWDGYNELTASSIRALVDGAKLVLDSGEQCSGFGATSLYWRAKSLGDDGGETVARMVANNNTVVALDMGRNMLWRDAGKAVGRMLEKNTTLRSLKLDMNNLTIDDRQKCEAPHAILKGLQANTTLEECFLQYCGISSDMFELMKDAIPFADINNDKDGETSPSDDVAATIR
jgi:hypothetical protein